MIHECQLMTHEFQPKIKFFIQWPINFGRWANFSSNDQSISAYDPSISAGDPSILANDPSIDVVRVCDLPCSVLSDRVLHTQKHGKIVCNSWIIGWNRWVTSWNRWVIGWNRWVIGRKICSSAEIDGVIGWKIGSLAEIHGSLAEIDWENQGMLFWCISGSFLCFAVFSGMCWSHFFLVFL